MPVQAAANSAKHAAATARRVLVGNSSLPAASNVRVALVSGRALPVTSQPGCQANPVGPSTVSVDYPIGAASLRSVPALTRVGGVTGGLNSTSAALLGLLHDGPFTGGQLVAHADRRLGPLWTVTRSQVYRELPVLANLGYVRAGKPGARASLAYTISAAGKRAFAAWLRSPLEADHSRNPLVLRLGFGSLHTKTELRRLLAEAREQHQASLAVHKDNATTLKKSRGDAYPLAAAEFGIAYEKAMLKWLDTIPT